MQYIRLLILAVLCFINLTFTSSVSAQDAERPIPIPIRIYRPGYPAPARAERVSGTVLVDIKVNSEGKVIEAKAVMGHKLLREEAQKAAFGFLFKPFKSAGKTFTVRLTYIFHDESYTKPEKEPDFTSPYQIEVYLR